ncbi:MAG: NADH-quinone oxidoreductase subunit C [Candidatus Thermoplasmatota archaeon]|nr:NADH-quinone oxidoreductase subunit C [Candidatus Thermoplasmatota archaeon]
MSEGDQLTPKEIVKSFKDTFKTKIKDDRIETHKAGSKKTQFTHIWMRVDKSVFKDAVRHLMTMEEYPHLAVVSGYDMGKTIDLVYHFSICFGERGKELSLNMTIELPKAKPEIETLTDLIPGALITEQEKQEMLGIKVKGIPKDKRAFISDDFPKGMYPWRKDETGPEKMVRNLHEVKK